jgi:sugar phosphate isomerase/epimerase
MPDGDLSLIAQARALGCDVISLETCFLAPPGELDTGALLAAAGDLELALAWGHPQGLAFGTDEAALEDLLAWIGVAHELGSPMIRIVVGGPALRHAEPVEQQLERTVPWLRTITARAAGLGVTVAIENHADLNALELTDLIHRVGAGNLGVCFDTANAARVGDDVVAAARRFGDLVQMIHLKDVESPDSAADTVRGPHSVPYGTGVIPIDGVLDALAGPIAAGAPVCVEIAQLAPGADDLALIEDGVRWLQRR